MLNIFSSNETLSRYNISFDFQKLHTFEKRREESTRIRSKYPDRIPIICEVYSKDRKEIDLDKNKYLVPADLSVGQFIYVIRKRVKLKPEKAVYIHTENSVLPATSQIVGNLYKDNKNEDGFLYLIISTESTFG